MTAVGFQPRYVTPGLETHSGQFPEPGITARLDWIRVTGPETVLEQARALLCDRFGDATQSTKGAQWFSRGETWDPGVQLSSGHRAEIVMIDIRGERLGTMTLDAAIELLHDLVGMSLTPTRLDCAVDWVNQGVGLFDHVLASCKRNELCRLRNYSDTSVHVTEGLTKSKLLKLGSRGSPVCVRIYDKGLEQSLVISGIWERFEAEIKNDRAPQAAEKILGAVGRYAEQIAEVAFGTVDFREVNGRSELARRPRVGWWETLIRGLKPEPLRPIYDPATFEPWCQALRESYGRRILQMAEAVKTDPGTLLHWLLAGLNPATSPSRATVELCKVWPRSVDEAGIGAWGVQRGPR